MNSEEHFVDRYGKLFPPQLMMEHLAGDSFFSSRPIENAPHLNNDSNVLGSLLLKSLFLMGELPKMSIQFLFAYSMLFHRRRYVKYSLFRKCERISTKPNFKNLVLLSNL